MLETLLVAIALFSSSVVFSIVVGLGMMAAAMLFDIDIPARYGLKEFKYDFAVSVISGFVLGFKSGFAFYWYPIIMVGFFVGLYITQAATIWILKKVQNP